MLTRAIRFLGTLYLMRVPIITWAAMLALWYGFLSGSGAEPILRGIFDVSPPGASFPASVTQFAFVTLAALLAGTAIVVTARLVVRNSDRFGITPVNYPDVGPAIELILRFPTLLAVVAIVYAAFSLSEAGPGGKLSGIAVGFLIWYLLTFPVENFLFDSQWPPLVRFRTGNWILGDKIGYVTTVPVRNAQGQLVLDQNGEPRTQPQLYERQTFAFYQFGLSFLAFLAAALKHIFRDGQQPLIPTLSLVLLLMMLLCWGLGGIAFFLDRYRVPVISVIVFVCVLAGLNRQGDYYYEGIPRERPPLVDSGSVRGSALLRPAANHPEPVILVATTGGGIQAAAWTARVLTGLSREIGCFSEHVRLVSSVSGGSIGSMYFLANYEGGKLRQNPQTLDLDKEPVVVAAEASSLDQITWGLAYPDFGFGIFPFLKGVGPDAKGRWHFADGGSIFFDRGLMLEESWRFHLPETQRDIQLMDWRKDVANKLRPAAIFNSTLVETGDRFLLSTTDFDNSSTSSHTGRIEFMSQYPDSDLRIRTAARLSATFPYVSPAARLLQNDIDPGQKKYVKGSFHLHNEPHAVDGGYYDNYGMTSLLDWLHAAFQVLDCKVAHSSPGCQTAPRPPVLILQIRSSPTDNARRDLNTTFGFWFQLAHPVETLWNVRGTGQLSHNELDESLLDRIYPNVSSVVFEFSQTDKNGCRRSEPLNWHLTPDDIRALRKAWTDQHVWDDERKQWQAGKNIEQVRRFLNAGGCRAQAE